MFTLNEYNGTQTSGLLQCLGCGSFSSQRFISRAIREARNHYNFKLVLVPDHGIFLEVDVFAPFGFELLKGDLQLHVLFELKIVNEFSPQVLDVTLTFFLGDGQLLVPLEV